MGCKIAKNGITISIHALLAESDSAIWVQRQLYTNFYPRSPCGERQERKALIADVYIFLSTLSLRRATALEKALQGLHWQFLSTLSLRRATDNLKRNIMQMAISIHALLAESDFRNLH